jgi:hypothetical protein
LKDGYQNKVTNKRKMAIQYKRSVTQNMERKLKKKIRNSKNPNEREKWEKELLKYHSLNEMNQSKRKKKIAANRKISDEEAFQQAKKYNASQVAKKIAFEKELQNKKMERVKDLRGEALQEKKLKEDVIESFITYKVEHLEEIDERVKKLTDDEKNPISEKKAIEKINREIMDECYEKQMKAHKIQIIAKKENVSLERAEEILNEITEKVKQWIEQCNKE